MVETYIHTGGYASLTAEDSRNRAEHALAEGQDELGELLLPFALALSRLAARLAAAECTR